MSLILVEVFGLPLDAGLGQVDREALERVVLGSAGFVGLPRVVLGKGVGAARVIGSQTRQRQVVVVARPDLFQGNGASVMMVRVVDSLSIVGLFSG